MTDRSWLSAVILALLLLVAGCAAPYASDTATESPDTETTDPSQRTSTETARDATSSDPSDEKPGSEPGIDSPNGTGTAVGQSEQVVVKNGSLSVNATEVYQRVERLMGVDADTPTVQIRQLGAADFSRGRVSPRYRALGYQSDPGNGSRCGSFAPAYAASDEVIISPGNLTETGAELVLAHEYVHIIQRNVEGYDNLSAVGSHGLRHAVTEGTAVYVADAYAREYDKSWHDTTPLGIRECLYRSVGDTGRELSGRYYFGGRYFDQRLNSSTDISSVYRSPPNTTEQLVHGLAPSAEPPVDLSVTFEGTESWQANRPERMGELGVRTWLHTELSQDSVDTAATGWGNDTLASFGEENRTSVTWVTRWDTSSDADEFADAVDDIGGELETADVATVRHVRVSERTVVVFAGNESFVDGAEATGNGGNVTVIAPRGPSDEISSARRGPPVVS